jgi:hypothetical protein
MFWCSPLFAAPAANTFFWSQQVSKVLGQFENIRFLTAADVDNQPLASDARFFIPYP